MIPKKPATDMTRGCRLFGRDHVQGRVFLHTLLAACTLFATLPAAAADWRAEILPTPGPVKAIETVAGEPHILIGNGWFRIVTRSNAVTLAATAKPLPRPRPAGYLPDGRIAEGRHDISRAWLAEPTERYGHGVLGDRIEAGRLVIERRDRTLATVPAGDDAVFEDLEPRIAELDAARDRVIVVKSYLARGSAVAVVGAKDGAFGVLAETPPIGTPNRWLNPAGVADFDGDGAPDIALVRMPHVLGRLELWAWRGGALEKTRELEGVTNHVPGSRVLRMSAVGDFDGDGRPDLAIPSFDRRSLRLIAFMPALRDVARVALPSPVVTELAAVRDSAGGLAVLAALENGALVLVRR
jgi:hypothetical protein